MSIHIIIDGYNLIRQSNRLSVIDRRDIQSGREALIDTLAEYRKIKQHKITVVFDGTNAPSFSRRAEKLNGVKKIFSRKGELADTVIKRMALREREKALIVSSDLDIVNYAESHGSATISSPEFEEKVTMAVYIDTDESGMEDKGGWVPTTRKKGPKRRLSKKKRRSKVKINKL
ncbi:MAG: NYN domain-containing protein [Thermodesulfobacteriota bacterium]|nr:NYN domain-containing protein [Thermodesulfobacteriota bacterium]